MARRVPPHAPVTTAPSSKLPLPDSFEAGYLEFNGILPLEVAEGRLRVAVAGQPDVEVLDDLERTFGMPVEQIWEPAHGVQRLHAAIRRGREPREQGQERRRGLHVHVE